MFPDICHVRYYEKIRQNIFLTGKLALFFKSLSFQQPLMCYRLDLMACTVIARMPSGPSKFVP